MSRVVLVPIAVMTMAVFWFPGSAIADPPPTQVITAVAVGPNGQPINGYQEAPPQGNVTAVNDCTAPSPSAVADNIYYGGPLPPVQHPATPDPFALTLDDGTHCLFRNGGAWGGRDDGYVGVYGCGDPSANLAVLWLPSQGAGTCIDRSAPVWTVKVGQLGAPGAHFPAPQTRAVTTAWFAGN